MILKLLHSRLGNCLIDTTMNLTFYLKRCSACNEIGATLACKSSSSCLKIFHYVCARQIGMYTFNFSIIFKYFTLFPIYLQVPIIYLLMNYTINDTFHNISICVMCNVTISAFQIVSTINMLFVLLAINYCVKFFWPFKESFEIF